MLDSSNAALAAKKWEELELLQKHYAKFEDFLYDVMTELLGFQCSDIQIDIGKFIAYGPDYIMVQAQRGQAKTTITAIYAVWSLIHNPTLRVLIVSAGSDMATEIANWIIQIIMHMPELECLRPDTSYGDRSSVKAFDVHYLLKGPEKSPSVACVGITSNLQGKRADLLIPDDIESSKNSQTQVQREKLKQLTLDFTSINSTGRIVYLGTPQSVDSIYNGLPGRGFTIRIWPGRYPTVEEEKNYNGLLAPLITERMRLNPSLRTGGGPTGSRGKPTDPVLLGEDKLTAKELDQGKAYFQLQHMLDTRLTDADRYPLKLSQLLVMRIPSEKTPIDLRWAPSPTYQVLFPHGMNMSEHLYKVHSFGETFVPFEGTYMYVDPSGGGQNGDELAYAVTKFAAGYIFVVDWGGIPGGLTEDKQDFLISKIERWKPEKIGIEENFGKGALAQLLRPRLIAKQIKCVIEDVWESGQKELRIIDVLEPIIGANRLVIDEDMITEDWVSTSQYDIAKRPTYSLFWQMSKLTRDKRSLIHDDRLDALAGSVRFWVERLNRDKEKEAAKAAQASYKTLMSNPLGNGRSLAQMMGRGSKHTFSPINRYDRIRNR